MQTRKVKGTMKLNQCLLYLETTLLYSRAA